MKKIAHFALAAIALVALSLMTVSGCTQADDDSEAPSPGFGAGGAPSTTPPAPAAASVESDVIRVEPETMMEPPGPAVLDMEPGDDGSTDFSVTEESGEIHSGSVTSDPELDAEDIGLPVPEGAARIAGGTIDELDSPAVAGLGSVAGVAGVSYETDEDIDSVAAFYDEHASGRFAEMDEPIWSQLGMRVFRDSDQEAYVALARTENGGTSIQTLRLP